MEGASRIEVWVLGPTLVTAGDHEIPLRRPTERALAVRLALAAGQPVLVSRLVRDLWRDLDEFTGEPRLQVVASRLRVALGPHRGAVEHTAGGYRLVGARASDLDELTTISHALDTDLRAGRHTNALERASTALRAWRGHALQDLRKFPFAEAEARRLDEIELTLRLRRATAQIQLGHPDTAIHELTALAAAHPYHELVYMSLAHALYCAGRQADALARLNQLRRTLRRDLGLGPSPIASHLEHRILRHDPTLRPGVDTHRRITADNAPILTSPAPVIGAGPPRIAGVWPHGDLGEDRRCRPGHRHRL